MEDENRLLSEAEACDYLLEKHGIDYKPSTLRTKRTTGGGPKYFRIKKSPKYTPATLDEHAHGQTKRAFSSTAEET